jgi:hypothetical protein
MLRAILVAAFVLVDLRLVIPPVVVGLPFGWDARVYTEAARIVLAGGNPWTEGGPIAFAAPPPSVIPFLPLVGMSDQAVSVLLVGLNVAAAAYVIDRLRLPWYFVLFPPIVLSTIAGSLALPAIAAVLVGTEAWGGLAILARIYMAVPYAILGQWRPLLVGAALVVLSLPMWPMFLESREVAAATLARQSGGGLSALALPWTVPIAVLALVLLGRDRAAWLAVPALWPDTQLYYAVIALPVLRTMPWATLALAVPIPGLVVVGLAVEAMRTRATWPAGWSAWRRWRPTSAGPARPQSTP